MVKNHKIIKLNDADATKVCGGNELCGKALEGLGGIVGVSAVLGLIASEITSTVYVLKANKALNKGNISDGKNFSKIAQYTKIAAMSCCAGAVAGAVTYCVGDKVAKRATESGNPDGNS